MIPCPVDQLAARLQGRVVGDGSVVVQRLDAIEFGDEGTLTFARDASFARQWQASAVGAVLVAESVMAELGETVPAGRAAIVVADADLAMLSLLEMASVPAVQPEAGIHPHATIHPEATIGADVRIGPGVCVGPGSTIGDGASLHANVVIGAGVTVGAGTEIRANTVIGDRCAVGAGCLFHPGVVIGADGFGFRPSPDGRGILKIPHIGTVQIGDDVEIGANSAVDRGKFGATVVGSGTKIDNLVQIGHNVRIGRCCVICGTCAIAGSVIIGDGVTLAGAVNVADGLRIGDGVTVGGRSTVGNDLAPGETYLGTPAIPAAEAKRQYIAMRRLPDALRELRKLSKQ